MSTIIRPELSKRNKYWIEKHRYYELKHFCMQYPTWSRIINTIDGFSSRPDLTAISGDISDPTFKAVEARDFYLRRMDMVKDCALSVDPIIGKDILQAVITGQSYDTLNAKKDIPCSKDCYYDLYRKFFWLLSIARK